MDTSCRVWAECAFVSVSMMLFWFWSKSFSDPKPVVSKSTEGSSPAACRKIQKTKSPSLMHAVLYSFQFIDMGGTISHFIASCKKRKEEAVCLWGDQSRPAAPPHWKEAALFWSQPTWRRPQGGPGHAAEMKSLQLGLESLGVSPGGAEGSKRPLWQVSRRTWIQNMIQPLQSCLCTSPLRKAGEDMQQTAAGQTKVAPHIWFYIKIWCWVFKTYSHFYR